jgi:hypothetical protein
LIKLGRRLRSATLRCSIFSCDRRKVVA